MSLTNEQNNFLRCICDVLGFEHPDNLSDEQEEALLDCFKTLTTTKEKTKTKTKTKADTKTKQGKPGNVWITWLQLNRDAIKSENGGENGLVAILSERYAVFKKTSAFKKLQEKCKEKMEEYKSDKSAAEDSDDDEPKAKKAKKAKKVEKSPAEKRPLNTFMAFAKIHRNKIDERKSKTGENFNDAKKNSYADFKKTPEFKVFEAKCTEELLLWNQKRVKIPNPNPRLR